MRGWMWFIFAYMTLIALGAFMDSAFSTTELSRLDIVMQMDVLTTREWHFLWFDFTTPWVNTLFFTTIFNMLVFNFDMFSGDLNFVRYFIWMVMAAGFGYIFVTRIAPALTSILADLRRMLPI